MLALYSRVGLQSTDMIIDKWHLQESIQAEFKIFLPHPRVSARYRCQLLVRVLVPQTAET